MSAPFGIEVNAALSESLVLDRLAGSKVTVRPPSPHPLFAQYIVDHNASHGVFWIKGIGNSIEGDGYGSGVRDQFERVNSQLSSKYGQAETMDFRDPNGIWEEAKDWIASLDQGERSFFRHWQKSAGVDLPEDLSSVFLGIQTYSFSDAAIVLEYASSNFDQAVAANDASLADLL